MAYLLLDEIRMALSPHSEERNVAAGLFKLEQTPPLPEQYRIAQSLKAYLIASKRQDLLAELVLWWHRSHGPRQRVPANLNPFQEDPMLGERMEQWVDELEAKCIAEGEARGEARGKAEGKAEGKVEGEAHGLIAMVRRNLAKGRISIDEARIEIREMMASGEIPLAAGEIALDQLG